MKNNVRKGKVEISDTLMAYCKKNLKNGCASCKIRQECHTPCRMSYEAIDEKTTTLNELVSKIIKS